MAFMLYKLSLKLLSSVVDPEFKKRRAQIQFFLKFSVYFRKLTKKKREGFMFLKEDGPPLLDPFVIQKSFLCSLGEISLVYDLHIEKKVVFVWFFQIQCSVLSMFCVLSTKEQLVDESLGEAFLGGPQTLHPIFCLI